MGPKQALLATAAGVLAWPVTAQVPAAPPTQAQVATPAQQPDLSVTPSSPRDAGDIIVTARKRQESILKVPVIEAAIPQVQIERRATTDLKDIAKIVPGLQLAESNGILGTQVSLRGIGTSAINVGIDASVSLNVDGLQITQSTAYASAIFDLAQVEVLKGPQALFYGKNSPGGVIALHTADPTDKFELIARYGHEFEANENRGELIVSGPVTDTLKLRIAGLYDTSDGYFHNVAIAAPGLGGLDPIDRSVPYMRDYIVRGTALWTPAPEFTARLKVNVTGSRSENSQLQYRSCPDGVGAVPPNNIPFLAGNENCKFDRTTNVLRFDPAAFGGLPNGGVPYVDTRERFGTLELTYRPAPDLSLTSTTGYFDIVSHSLTSGSGATYAGSSFASEGEPLARHDFTQEVRATSDFKGPFNFTAGGYYQHAHINNRVNLPANQDLNLDPFPLGPVIHLPSTIGNYQELVGIESYSGFAQLRYKIVPKVELAAGVRYTHETRNLTAYNYATGSAVLFPTAVPKISSSNWAPEVTLTYQPTDDVTLFASYKKAYKSGSFTLTALTTPNPDLSFGDEKAEGGEGGVKARLFDRSLTTSIAVYDYLYKGLQVGTITPATNGVPVNRTLNAGAARTYGVDFETTYRPPFLQELTLKGAVAWNHARFKRLDGVPCSGGQTIAAGCTEVPNPVTGLFTGQNLAGSPLVRAPDWQATFGFDYELPVGRGMKLVLSNLNEYTSRYLTDLGLRSDFYQGSFLKADLSAALQGPDNRWELAVIGKNVGGKITTGNCFNSNAQGGAILGGQVTGGTGRGPSGVDEVACYADAGREVWLRLTVHLTR